MALILPINCQMWLFMISTLSSILHVASTSTRVLEDISSLSISDRHENVMNISSEASSLNNNTTLQLIFKTNLSLPEESFDEHCLTNYNSLATLFTMVLYSVVCFVGLFGNTLVIYVVLRFSKMQTVTNIYILNLAIADECFLIGIPFLLYTMRICSWKFGEYMCKAYMVSTSITQFTSSIFLLIMSADRYIAVCHPITSPRYRTVHIAKIVSAIAWLTSALLMLPVILFASTVRQENGVNYSCNIEWPDAHTLHSGTTFILYTFALGFATPLCFILCFYWLVIRKLHSVGPKQKSKEKRRTHRKVTRLVLTVITVYILCWLPHWISQLILIHSHPSQTDLTRLGIIIFLLLGCLAYSNSAMNPVLYAFLSDNFKKSFLKAFVCGDGNSVSAQLQMEPSCTRTRISGRRLKRVSKAVRCSQDQQSSDQRNVKQAQSSSTTTSSTTTAEKVSGSLSVSSPPQVSLMVPRNDLQNGRVPTIIENTSVLVEDYETLICQLPVDPKTTVQTNL